MSAFLIGSLKKKININFIYMSLYTSYTIYIKNILKNEQKSRDAAA